MPARKPTAARVLAATLLLTTALAIPAIAQDPLADARELYASAAYEEALAALKMARDRGGPDVGRLADEYSAFCLLALGRRPEAEAAAESAIRINPLSTLDTRDVSPRVEDMFLQVRKRLLPEMIRAEYKTTRDIMNRGDAGQSLDQLLRMRQMLDLSRALGVWDDTLGDFSTLVDGFLELNAAKVAELKAKTPPAPARSTAAVAAAAPAPRTIFSSADTDVTPPTALRQDIPEITLDSPTLGNRRSGVLAVTINERGEVQDVAMRESISIAVDAQLVKAARAWRYGPAVKDGKPVRYLKFIGITIGK